MTEARRAGGKFRPAPWKPPTIPQTQEALVQLYLRLNGYLTTGFIVHSIEGDKAQVDALAVRHPHNAEPERVIEPSRFLDPSTSVVDVLICEVKSHPNDFAFNEGLREDVDALTTVLRWVGVFREPELTKAIEGVRPLLTPDCAPEVARSGFVSEGIRVRALLCAPAVAADATAGVWFLPREEILTFVRDCLTGRRAQSGTRYNFSHWGPWFEPLVRYFKDLDTQSEPELDELYQCTGAIPIKDPSPAE